MEHKTRTGSRFVRDMYHRHNRKGVKPPMRTWARAVLANKAGDAEELNALATWARGKRLTPGVSP